MALPFLDLGSFGDYYGSRNTPFLQKDFLENNWDTMFPSMFPGTANGFTFTNFLRSRRPEYERQYQGLAAQGMANGGIPNLTGGSFLDKVFGSGGGWTPALHDYLTTSPFERGERVDRLMPGRFRF